MDKKPFSVAWNPWHGCTKISEGCRYCYVYRQDARYGAEESNLCRKTAAFSLPVKKKRGGEYKIESGSIVYTCFTSDFLLPDADEWRWDCWSMMRERRDLSFIFFTKRIERLEKCLPHDWNDGYENVIIGCTAENQKRADERLPVFRALPIAHRLIIAAPLLEKIDLSPYLDEKIEEVSAGGESGVCARPLHYEWVTEMREQCIEKNIPFCFHQTGAHFVKDGKLYTIPRRYQHSQARRAGIDFRIRDDRLPDTVQLTDGKNIKTNETDGGAREKQMSVFD